MGVCVSNGWRSAFGKKHSKNGKRPSPSVHADLLRRSFTADAANRLWSADGTERSQDLPERDQDESSDWIVCYSISGRMKSPLAADALASAIARRREVAGCILPTNRGSQGPGAVQSSVPCTATRWRLDRAGRRRPMTTRPWVSFALLQTKESRSMVRGRAPASPVSCHRPSSIMLPASLMSFVVVLKRSRGRAR